LELCADRLGVAGMLTIRSAVVHHEFTAKC
jgi:hypothetical protein